MPLLDSVFEIERDLGASAEELSSFILDFVSGYSRHLSRIRPAANPVSLDQVDWNKLRYLNILGSTIEQMDPRLTEAWLKNGAYLSESGDWLLLFLPGQNIQPYLDNCSATLEVLQIGYTNIASVSVHTLSGLKKLHLWNNHKLSEIQGFECLSELTHLNLHGCRSIPTLPDLHSLQHLVSIWCPYSGINLPKDFYFPPTLEYLSLANTPLLQLPDSIQQLKSLRLLNLQNLKLKNLPKWLPEITERFSLSANVLYYGESKAIVYLSGTTVEGVDMSIFEQPYKMVAKWFENPDNLPLNEIKVVFLGDGEAGKSLTVSRLINDGKIPKNYDGQATPGIAIHDLSYNLDGWDVQVHLWDFGGQEILHSMHRMFLTKRTLYVVLLNARDDTQDDRARYWLHNIKSFAPDAPVLLVLNKIDQNPTASINENGLRTLYPTLTEVVQLSALHFSPEEFNTTFTAALMRQISAFDVLNFPFTIAWRRLKDKLRTMSSHYIRSPEYADYCQECGVEESEDTRKALLEWFKDLGISFCYSESRKLEDYVVLQPQWITNAIYILLYNRIQGNINGIVPHDDIIRMLKRPDTLTDTIHRVLPGVYYTGDEVQYVLNVIRQFRLSYPIEDDKEFFPMLCDRNETDIVKDYAEHPDVLEFRMVYDYLPNNVLHRLMVDMHRDLQTDNVWLTGAHFLQSYSGLSAVVKSDGNVMTIYVRSIREYPAKIYLDAIKEHLERISTEMGLAIRMRQVVYTAGGISEVFNYKMVLGTLAKGRDEVYSMIRDDMVPIRDILRQTDYQVDSDRSRLLRDLLSACRDMQKNKLYWKVSENDRNTYIRDALNHMGYIAKDQTLAGISPGGRLPGELDLEILNNSGDTITILEGLNLPGTSLSRIEYWDDHLTKLLDHYNPMGLPFLVMVSYIPCPKDKYLTISSSFSEHSRSFSPEGYSLLEAGSEKTTPMHMEDTNFLQMMKCVYHCGGAMTTVYHIFVRLGDE